MNRSLLNHTMLPHLHKEKTDLLSLVEVTKFVELFDHSLLIFGNFVKVNLRVNIVSVKSRGTNVKFKKAVDYINPPN